MVAQLRKAVFSLDPATPGDERATFEGYTDDSDWNGWATPSFTFEVAMKIVHAFNALWPGHAAYNRATDEFLFGEAETSIEDSDPDSIYSVGPETSTVDGRETKLYPIGAGSWIWETDEVA